MNTKYGEVKSINDLFEDIKEEGEKPAIEGGKFIILNAKCKICGDRIKSSKYVGKYMYNHLTNMERHIELHRIINQV